MATTLLKTSNIIQLKYIHKVRHTEKVESNKISHQINLMEKPYNSLRKLSQNLHSKV